MEEQLAEEDWDKEEEELWHSHEDPFIIIIEHSLYWPLGHCLLPIFARV